MASATDTIHVYESDKASSLYQAESRIQANLECAIVHNERNGTWGVWVYGGYLFDERKRSDAVETANRHTSLWRKNPVLALGNPPD